MCQKESRSWLKVAALSVVTWLALVALINFILWISTDGGCDLKQICQMLPLTGLLCIFPAAYMVADHLRPVNRN